MQYYPPLRPIALCLLLLSAALNLNGREAVARVPLALETFDEVWGILNEGHFDTNFNGHNWLRVRDEYRPRVAAAKSGAGVRDVLQEMLDLLNVSHLAIVSSEEAEAMEANGKEAASLEAADESEA